MDFSNTENVANFSETLEHLVLVLMLLKLVANLNAKERRVGMWLAPL